MEIIDITPQSGEYLEQIWKIYDESFPSHEKQSRQRLFKLLAEEESFAIDGLLEDGRVIGLMAYWYFEDMAYLEHFALEPQSRCEGRGSAMLRGFIAKHHTKIVVGEIEPPQDEMSCRRQSFYLREGFVMGERFTFPPYQRGGEGFEMIFISHGTKIDSSKLERYVRFLKDIVTDGD